LDDGKTPVQKFNTGLILGYAPESGRIILWKYHWEFRRLLPLTSLSQGGVIEDAMDHLIMDLLLEAPKT
jgi:hypothetical protein